MSVPATTDEFLDCLNSSNVVDADRLTPYLTDCRRQNALPEKPKALAKQLVRDGLITPFQAQQCLPAGIATSSLANTACWNRSALAV